MSDTAVTARAALGALGVAALLLGPLALAAWLAVVAVAAGGELYRIGRARGARPVALVGLAGIVSLLAVAYLEGESGPRLFPAVVAATLGAAFVAMIVRSDRRETTRALALTIAPVLAAGMLGGYVVALRRSLFGFRLVLGLAILWAAAEIGMLVVRRVRSQSEHLTLERTGGAIVGALVASVALALAVDPPFEWGRSLVLAVLVGLSTAAGHQVGAMFDGDERRLRLVPLVDGLFLSAPVFFYAFRVIGR